MLALDADCVVYSPLIPNDDEVIAILRSGKNVVTPVGWVYPDPDNARGTGPFADAAVQGGVTLHGSGIHPGGITERFPLMLSSLSSAVTHVRAEEFSDIRTYNAPDVVRYIMGFGGTPEEAMQGPMAGLLHAGFKQSVRMIADHMGFRIDSNIRTIQDVAVATSEIDYRPFPLPAGTVAARRFRWQALVDGEPVITAAVNWLMGEENLEPDWNFGGRGERFEVEITGDPTVNLTFKGLQPDSIAEGLNEIRGWWPPPTIASTPFPTSAPPGPASRPTWTCRYSPGARHRASRRRHRDKLQRAQRRLVLSPRGRGYRHGSLPGLLPGRARHGGRLRNPDLG